MKRFLPMVFFSFILILGLSLTGVAQAQPLAMILTERAAAYRTVASEIEEQLGGQIAAYDMHNSHANDEKIIGKISQQKPQLIIAIGDKAAHLASQKLSSFPILIGVVLELGQEVFRQPNIQGVGLQIPPESVLTQLRLVYPGLKRLGVLSSGTRFKAFRETIQRTASGVGMRVKDITVPNKKDLQAKITQELSGLDAIWLLPDPTVLDSETYRSIVNIAKRSKKALIVYSENFVRAGALFSVSPDYEATGQQMVLLIRKMLAKNLTPPEKPYLSKFHYPIGSYSVLNMSTAKSIGMKLSSDQLTFINRIVDGN